MDFPGGSGVGTSPSNAGGAGSTLVRKLRSHMSLGQKKSKQTQDCNKFNTDFFKKREKQAGCGTLLAFISSALRKSEFQTSAH